MSRICLGVLVTLTLLTAGCGGYGSNNMGGGAGAPNITSLTPNMANANDPAFTLTVNGSGFGTDSVVYWNGAALPSAYGTGTKVTAQVPAMDVMNAGMFPVYVRSGGKNSNMINFTVQ
ncbi:MAG: IPT/TIG domain-containing protein [Terriglobales bacterium]